MKSKFNIIGIGIILIIISVYSYIFYKAPVFENKLQNILIKQSNHIINTYKKLSENSTNYTNLIRKIIHKNKNIALLTIIQNGKAIITHKNNKYFSSNDYQNIIDTFWVKNNKSNQDSLLKIKYHNNKKFYIYPYKINKTTLLIVFPYKLSKALIINPIIELLLILIINVIFCMILHITFKPKTNKHLKQTGEKTIKSNNGNNKNEKTLKDIFKELYNSEKLSSLSLTIYNKSLPNIKYKYNYLRNEVYKYEDNTLNIESQKDLFKELKNGHNLYINKNKKLVIPIILKNKLTACLNISSEKAFSGESLQNIKEKNLKSISAILREQ